MHIVATKQSNTRTLFFSLSHSLPSHPHSIYHDIQNTLSFSSVCATPPTIVAGRHVRPERVGRGWPARRRDGDQGDAAARVVVSMPSKRVGGRVLKPVVPPPRAPVAQGDPAGGDRGGRSRSSGDRGLASRMGGGRAAPTTTARGRTDRARRPIPATTPPAGRRPTKGRKAHVSHQAGRQDHGQGGRPHAGRAAPGQGAL